MAWLSLTFALVPLLHVQVLLDAAFSLRGGAVPALGLRGFVDLLSLSIDVGAVGAIRDHHCAVVSFVSTARLRAPVRQVGVLGISSASPAVQYRRRLQR